MHQDIIRIYYQPTSALYACTDIAPQRENTIILPLLISILVSGLSVNIAWYACQLASRIKDGDIV